MTVLLSVCTCVLALVPALLFLRNLRLYAPPPDAPAAHAPPCSVLIPARNEEARIAASVHAALAACSPDSEVIVLDDASTDRTAAIVREIAAADARLRLESAPPLPAGWCGKPHACQVLAGMANHPLLVFVDADVSLRPDAAARLAAFMDASGAALASGVPRQEVVTFSERLLIPLIHFVLLGFLPISRMRRRRDPSLGAGCGQLVVARRDAYHAAGGHAGIRATLHDGPNLARLFRRKGLATDLFDATTVATCRMYSRNAEVWEGLAKNAHEGLGTPRLIAPATLLLLGGQVLPFGLLATALLTKIPAPAIIFAVAGAAAALLPRILAASRFLQPVLFCLLHPLAIPALLGIQWFAFIRSQLRRPATWKGRACKFAEVS